MDDRLDELLDAAAALHRHLCPRQVLGVRMGLAAGHALGIEVPRTDKRLITFVETDGCGADGVSVATGCWVGRRTLRIFDYGKLAATVVDRSTGQAVRVRPTESARDCAFEHAPDAPSEWHAMLSGYRAMPTEQLVSVERVRLTIDLQALISRPGVRVRCADCGEEVMNEREMVRDGRAICQACAAGAYYEREPTTV
jgi:formylmethanofuran dehydrogenase subunit E